MKTKADNINPQSTIFRSIVQPQLTIGAINDAYEREADYVADTILRMPDVSFVQTSTNRVGARIQKQEDTNADSATSEPVSLQLPPPDFLAMRRPFFNRGVPQLWDAGSALRIWSYNFDFFRRLGLDERLSGRAANLTAPFFIDSQLKTANPTWWERTDREMNTTSIAGSLPLLNFDANFRNLQLLPFIQRKCADCDEEEKLMRKPLSSFLQMKGSDGGVDASQSVSDTIQSTRGSGSSMDSVTKGFMETRFGTDFSNVRIHTGSEAVQMSRELNAQAFTVGSDIYFNNAKYDPKSDKGKYLLAHELTHVMQQAKSPATGVRRTPDYSHTAATSVPTPINGTATPATDADVRATVTEATRMLEQSADFFKLADIDDVRMERVLTSWITMSTIYPGLIDSRLNGDTLLMEAFKTAFNTAVRVLFTRRAAQTGANISVIQLYLSNLYRLPNWSWPGVATFNFTNDTQRRAFVNDYINTLNINSLFQEFTAITSSQLEQVLQYLFSLTTDTQNIIANNLSNDATLVSRLELAYRNSINNLLSRAALSINGETVFSLFMLYRYRRTGMIHEWADQRIPGTTVAIPLGQSPDPLTGDIRFNYNGYNVTMRADGAQRENGAQTHADFTQNNIAYLYNTSNNRITSFTSPATPSLTIWTDYGPDVTSRSGSGYGRGTTAEDVRLGNTSLGYHERSHSRDFLNFLANTAPPVFRGTVGMTVRQFRAAITAYHNTLARITRISELSTDCVGSPTIVQYHAAHGTRTTVTCP
jgi:hypothetical protein